MSELNEMEQKLKDALAEAGVPDEVFRVIDKLEQKEFNLANKVVEQLVPEFYHRLLIRVAISTMGHDEYRKLRDEMLAKATKEVMEEMDGGDDSILNLFAQASGKGGFFEAMGVNKERVLEGILALSKHKIYNMER